MTDLRKRIYTAIYDPGHSGEGYKGERSLTEWQTDAVMRVVADLERERDEAREALSQAHGSLKALGAENGYAAAAIRSLQAKGERG